ncbi:hypothetical protein TrCOL_g5883 [Triparma columacea]|uniref:Bola-like protein n=1 Tax=Triparma columacea TaxID=722753 RepID=A0A9W7GP48_9STRA|nr:hypothetical protein TrCOL_g5883 [Triparma columacea]
MFGLSRAVTRCATATPSLLRFFSAEEKMRDAILSGFSEDTFVEVKDISGGCGSMYAIEVESLDFKGVSKVKQSRMVNDLIKKEIGEMHGLTLKTRVPK